MIILIGPSASGKTEIVKYLVNYCNYKKFVTTTTRDKRVNEINGIDYNFITKEEFNNKIKNNEFIEYVNYNNNFYGTEKKNISNDICLIIEPDGLKKFKSLNDKNIVSFYLDSSNEIRKERMIARLDKLEDIEKRLAIDDGIFNKDKLVNYIDYSIDTNKESIKNLAKKIDQLYKKKINLN